MYTYRAAIVHVLDGDTVDVRLDLGFHIAIELRLRLAGIDAPEVRTDAGRAAQTWLRQLLPPATPVTVRTERDRREKYGRYLAVVIMADGVNVNELLISMGHASHYPPR